MPKKKGKNDNFIIGSLILSLFLIWSGFYWSYPDVFVLSEKAVKSTPQAIEQEKVLKQKMLFGHLDLEAKAFAVYEIETGDLIAGKNEAKILPLASITKIMTALIANNSSTSGQQIITITEAGGADNFLHKNEKWSVSNLTALTLVSSSNEGALALAGADRDQFIDKMNRQATDLHLSDLHFNNPTGLDEKTTPGGQGSAVSVAKLFSYLIKNKPDLLTVTRQKEITKISLDQISYTATNTNKIIDKIPGIIASKTGYTQMAGGNLAIATNLQLNQPIVIVVLGSSEMGRFSDMEKLVKASINYYTSIKS